MAVREIIQLGNPVLWERSAAVKRPESDETREVVRDLNETLAAFRRGNGFGRGIAAPQIGVLRRVIYVRMPDGSFDGGLINPEIVWSSDARVELWDACFSFPGLMVRVARAREIRVRYFDGEGMEREVAATGGLSELLQHEIDHLDGILAIDRAVGGRALATREEWERMGRPE